MDKALDSVFFGLLEEDAGTNDIGGVYIFWCVEGESGRSVNNDIRASHALTDCFAIANVALGESDLVPLWVGEIYQINAGDVFVSIGAQVAHEVDAQKTADTTDVNLDSSLRCYMRKYRL